jgi:hypothetical protein
MTAALLFLKGPTFRRDIFISMNQVPPLPLKPLKNSTPFSASNKTSTPPSKSRTLPQKSTVDGAPKTYYLESIFMIKKVS